jgi:sortase A
VPKFVAGHLQGTGVPGSGGNVVLSGHVQSMASGNVFANIDKLKVGDEVTLRTTAGEVVYRIDGKNIVKNDDLSVVEATKTEELTLITCTGTFNILTQDYTHRWVVWGTRVEG